MSNPESLIFQAFRFLLESGDGTYPAALYYSALQTECLALCYLDIDNLSYKLSAALEVHKLEAVGSSRKCVFVFLAHTFNKNLLYSALICCIFLCAD